MAAPAANLIAAAADPELESRLRRRIEDCRGPSGSLGELEPLAIRLGLIQNTLAPRFSAARLVLFAADHGLAVDDVAADQLQSTAATVQALLEGRSPLARLADAQGLELSVVDSGIAATLAPNARLLSRKIAHGTRNSRAGEAMTTEQAHAALRAGMEIGDALGGDAVACAGIGIGSAQSAALLLACVTDTPLDAFIDPDEPAGSGLREHRLRVLTDVRSRHGHLEDPVELLAAVGGFEVAMMAGLMLVAAGRRRLIIADGLAACASLVVASAIAPGIGDYCVHARSNDLSSLDHALDLLGAQAFGRPGLSSLDGTGAVLAWPLIGCAAALLGDGPASAFTRGSGATPPSPATARRHARDTPRA